MLLLNQLKKQEDAIDGIAMYGRETWTIGEAERKGWKLSKCGARMKNIKWMDG